MTDYLGLVGDAADGYPGLPGWGAKSTAVVLARYEHIEQIPLDLADWDIQVRGAARLAKVLNEQREQALLYRTLATLRTDALALESVDELMWTGPTAGFFDICARLNVPGYFRRARAAAADRISLE